MRYLSTVDPGEDLAGGCRLREGDPEPLWTQH